MAFDVQQIIRLASQLGGSREQAAKELGGLAEVDPQQHGYLLERVGIDPQRLQSGGYDSHLQGGQDIAGSAPPAFPGGAGDANEGGFPQETRFPEGGTGYQQRGEDREQGQFYQDQTGLQEGGYQGGGGFPGQSSYEDGVFGQQGSFGSGGAAQGRYREDDTEDVMEERAGYGPAPGEGRGGYGQQAGLMPGSSDEPDDEPDTAQGGYPVGEEESGYGERRHGDESRNPDYR